MVLSYDFPNNSTIRRIKRSASKGCSLIDYLLSHEMCGDDDFYLQAIAGSLQSLCWASAAAGGVASAYFSGSLLESYGTHGVFALTAVFPLIVSFSAILITESPVQESHAERSGSVVGTTLTSIYISMNLASFSRAALLQKSIHHLICFENVQWHCEVTAISNLTGICWSYVHTIRLSFSWTSALQMWMGNPFIVKAKHLRLFRNFSCQFSNFLLMISFMPTKLGS